MKMPGLLKHEFVEFIPEELKQGMIYVCIAYATVAHKCCCGCGNEVVTPLSPTDWKLIFDGASISLDPSVGNWSFDCKSHYWIRNNQVEWAERWSRERIEAGRALDRWAKDRHFSSAGGFSAAAAKAEIQKTCPPKQGFWEKLQKWWSS